MSDGLRIRAATEQDLPDVRALLVATWHDTYDSIYGVESVTAITDDWHSIPRLENGLSRPDHVFLVAEVGEAVVGTASATDKGGGLVWLDRLYVHPSHQRKGLGAELLKAVRAAFPHARTCRLEVESRNQRGLDFYRKAGFSGEQPGYCHREAKALELERHWTGGA